MANQPVQHNYSLAEHMPTHPPPSSSSSSQVGTVQPPLGQFYLNHPPQQHYLHNYLLPKDPFHSARHNNQETHSAFSPFAQAIAEYQARFAPQNHRRTPAAQAHGGYNAFSFPGSWDNFHYNNQDQEGPVDWSYVPSSSFGNATTMGMQRGNTYPEGPRQRVDDDIMLFEAIDVTANNILDAGPNHIFFMMNHPQYFFVFSGLLLWCSIHSGHLLSRIVFAVTGEGSVQNLAGTVRNVFGLSSIHIMMEILTWVPGPFFNIVMSALRPHVSFLMQDNNGRQLMRYLCNCDGEVVYTVAIENCLQWACDNESSYFVRDVMKNIKQHFKNQLLRKLAEASVALSLHPNGNYILQEVVDLADPDIMNNICGKLKHRLVQLSMHSLGTSVIQKFLNSTIVTAVEDLASELVNSNKLIQIYQDQFGYYVIKCTLKVTELRLPDLHRKLWERLRRPDHMERM